MIIDVHGHITSPDQLERYPMPKSLGDIAGMIERKREAGIDLTIVGTPCGRGTMTRMPGHDNFDQGVEDLRAFNGWMAEMVEAHAPHLAAYAYTNPYGGEAMLHDAAATVRDGGFVGLIVNSSVRGEYLDGSKADDFWAMAAELDVPIMLHAPAEPVGSDALTSFRLVEQASRFCDVTLGMAAIIWSGRLEQHPNLRLIASTAGGALALLIDRLDAAYSALHWGGGPPGSGPPGSGPPGGRPPGGEPAGGRPPGGNPMAEPLQISRPPSTFLDQVYVETATPSRAHLRANLEVFGPDRVMFGTDSPPLLRPVEEIVRDVEEQLGDEETRRKVLTDNAAQLFGLARTGGGPVAGSAA